MGDFYATSYYGILSVLVSRNLSNTGNYCVTTLARFFAKFVFQELQGARCFAHGSLGEVLKGFESRGPLA